MGRSPSSSRRKKRSKARSRKRTKTESRKHESKKLHRRVSDDDDSRSSMSSSSYSSSSEDSTHRSKKSLVRIRKRVVSGKKKTNKRSYCSDSSEDLRRERKRGGSNRKRDNKNKNRKYSKKKKRRREDSVSSTSRSSSCSTCQSDDSISSHRVESERYGRKKRGKEERDDRNSAKLERGTKRSRYRSVSPSCSERSGEYRATEKVLVENNSRRLRSVITVVKRDEEDRDFSPDEHKEEIVYDYDEYPSSRSNDSTNTGRQRDENIMRSENEKDDDDGVSNFRLLETVNTKEITSDESGSIGGAKSEDLESVLRQRALENLRRFRGGTKTSGLTTDNQKNHNDGDTKQPSFQIRSASKVVVSNETQLATEIRVPDEPVSAKTGSDVAGDSSEKFEVAVSGAKPKLVRPTLVSRLSKPNSSLDQPLLATGSSLDKTLIQNPQSNDIDVDNACNSAGAEPSTASSDKPVDEAVEEQFEQKTMTVVRGGEIVQLNYKVYIPKKPPALARRQFKR